MKNKFLNICIGLGILFVTGGFFLRSITTAHAAPQFMAEGTTKIGKYQMALGQNTEGNIRILIWDTETGKSQLFSEKIVDNKWTIAPSVYAVPEATFDK
jgi:hypothetical protein